MFVLQLYTDSYTPIQGERTINSTNVPRPGDVIFVKDSAYQSNVVFDVTHYIDGDRMKTVVRAREGSRQDRFYVLAENGYLDTQDEIRHGELDSDSDLP